MTQDTRTLIRVVAAIVLNRDGEFLLSSRPEGKPYAGYWEFAGGKVEAGETEFDALKRELAEELGLEIRRATPWLTKIHSYEHARVHLRFLRVEADDWSGEIQAKEGQKWAWQKAGDFTVSPMLPANSALLEALSVPRALTGRLKTGLHGENGAGAYFVAPYESAEPLHRNVLISEPGLRRLGKMPDAQSVWVIVENAAQWQRIQDADVGVWRVESEAAADGAAQALAAGVSIPLVVSATTELAAKHRRAWLEAGAQAVVIEDETEAV
ncbi:NUDIX domain-containing protein [Neisseria chenwenguii]|uniref:8-oxo-dGTP diphosphatase n=1 Tax=Neisseria chenwenguii TaxID=1853278 RepID=A0A220S3G4_9NEIS|nr:NUDIX domain-containing protein [Neisseria chenwenguii]ASK28014.1 NTP pyrophosphohydrolase [Neisseria chenwenguii]ROV57165.1 NUDIX domain-containing protein [Neisseria chenwenguii]